MDISAKEILNLANEISNEIVKDRRALHKFPEVGTNLPKTKAYVKNRLIELGYEVKELCESGLVAEIGVSGEKCVMLRADMDALKICEKTDLEFRSENENMHACGHDMHTAMLLGASKILKKYQNKLCGTVRLVFQPDEEGFTGAKAMIDEGVLNAPIPGAALALHVHSGTPSGAVLFGKGTFMAGCSPFRITITGKGCHGAMPEIGIDPTNVGAHIYLSLCHLVSHEISAKKSAVVSVGKFHSGHSQNVIPEKTVLEGTIRTFEDNLSKYLFKRIEEISKNIASSFNASAVVESLPSVPALINNPQLTDKFALYATELLGKNFVHNVGEGGMGSEDFAVYSHKLPCSYLLLGAGTKEENSLFGQSMHNEKVVFNEDILPIGAALHAYCAIKYLSE